MNIERVRTVLGVWAPMGIGLFIIVTSANFYFTAALPGDLESWRLVCSAGAFFVGGLLMLSTYGRYTKTKEARRESSRTSVTSTPATPQDSQRPESSTKEDGDR